MTAFRFSRHAFCPLILVLALWGYGFWSFVDDVRAYQEQPINDQLAPTDAVVVLTGGSERLKAGIDLLVAGKGKKLLISGVHPSVKASSSLSHEAIPQELQACCIVLGYQAGNTAGNANETTAFMAKEGFKSMRLVTANYHMPRSLLWLKHEMPDIQIEAYPVSPDMLNLKAWWTSPGTASLLALEYCKYLVAYAYVAIGG